MSNSQPGSQKRPDAAQFLIRLLALIAIVASPLMVAWVWHMPGIESPFPWAYDRMARGLATGKARWFDSDMRLLKAAYLRQMPARKEVLIFGGSRAGTIAAEWFPAGDAWNAAVADGGMDDAVAFFEVCVEANRVPYSVILEVFPALMEEENIANSRAAGIYLDRALRRYGIRAPWAPGDWGLRGDRILPDLRDAYRVLFGQIAEPGVPSWRVFPDGRVDFFEGMPATVETPTGKMEVMYSRPEWQWRMKSRPGEFALLMFHRFLDDLRSRGVQVTVFLAPVNPIVWDYFRAHGGFDETWIRGAMHDKGIPVAGTFSPIVAHAAPSDFYDAIHPLPALVRRLLGAAGVIPDDGGVSQ